MNRLTLDALARLEVKMSQNRVDVDTYQPFDIKVHRKMAWKALAIDVIGSKLANALDVWLDNNPSANAPYHNNQHMMAVALMADAIYVNEALIKGEVVKEDRECLFLAASLHDYNHSMGAQPDSWNIRHAQQAIDLLLSSGAVPMQMIARVMQSIETTEFPFTKDPTTLIERCLRDADLLMHIELDWDEFFEGLREETGNGAMTKEISYKWLSEQQMFTTKGRSLMHESLR